MGARRLLAVRDARVFLAGQAVSSLGDSALWLAVAVWVKGLTGSSGAAGLVFFFFSAPMLFAPISGLLVDRVRRRRLLIATNAFTGCAVLLLLLVDGAGQLWLIYVVMVVYGFSFSVLGAGQSALLTTMLPPELLADANGALRTIQGTLSLVAPLAGAGLFVLVGPQPIVILDAATFAVPVISLLCLRLEEPPPHPRKQRWRAELTAGVRHIGRTQVLRQVTVAAVCAVLGFGFSETTIFSVAGKGLHRAPAFVGLLLSIQGLGAILGGVTAAPLLRRLGECSLIAAGLLLLGAGALLEIPASLPSVIAGVIVFGVSLPWVIVSLTTLLQRATPPELQGRVYAAAEALITTPQTISIAVGAALIGVVGYRSLLVAMAAANAVAAGYLLTRRRLPAADRSWDSRVSVV
jgi:MFS family permease